MEREEGLSEDAHAYYDLRDERVAQNAERMKSLGLATLSGDLVALNKTAHVQKPRKKRVLESTIPESTRVLRSQLVIHGFGNEEGSENTSADQLEEHEELGLDNQQKNTRKGRKRTRMHTVYDRANMPPVPVSFNEKGQPDGDNASEFSNFIATLVKTHIPLGHEDWRLVDVEKKNALLSTLI